VEKLQDSCDRGQDWRRSRSRLSIATTTTTTIAEMTANVTIPTPDHNHVLSHQGRIAPPLDIKSENRAGYFRPCGSRRSRDPS
jgi:hypothetical protein